MSLLLLLSLMSFMGFSVALYRLLCCEFCPLSSFSFSSCCFFSRSNSIILQSLAHIEMVKFVCSLLISWQLLHNDQWIDIDWQMAWPYVVSGVISKIFSIFGYFTGSGSMIAYQIGVDEDSLLPFELVNDQVSVWCFSQEGNSSEAKPNKNEYHRHEHLKQCPSLIPGVCCKSSGHQGCCLLGQDRDCTLAPPVAIDLSGFF